MEEEIQDTPEAENLFDQAPEGAVEEEIIDVEELSQATGRDLSEYTEDQIRAIYETHKPAVQGMNKAQQEAAELREKAATLDKLMADPKALRDLVVALGGDGEQTQDTGTGNGLSFNLHPDFDYSEVLEGDAIPAVEALVGNYLDRVLGDQATQLVQAVSYLIQKDQGSEWSQVSSQYDNASEYEDQVRAFRQQNPNLSWEQALFAVAGKDLVAATTQDAPSSNGKRVVTKQKGVPLTKPSNVPGSRTTSEVSRPASRADRQTALADYIKKMAKSQGVTFGS